VPRRWKIFLLVALLAVAADQGSKLWARHSLPVVGHGCTIPDSLVSHACYARSVPLIDGYWDWHLSFNPSSAFGLFPESGARVLLSLIGVLAVFAMGWMVRRAKDSQTGMLVALGLVAGGAIGNMIDRIYFGVVTDFTLWHWKDKATWNVFNVADVVLVVGVALLILAPGKAHKDEPAKAVPAAPPDRA